jgi:hypothetical protein
MQIANEFDLPYDITIEEYFNQHEHLVETRSITYPVYVLLEDDARTKELRKKGAKVNVKLTPLPKTTTLTGIWVGEWLDNLTCEPHGIGDIDAGFKILDVYNKIEKELNDCYGFVLIKYINELNDVKYTLILNGSIKRKK